MGEIYLFPYKQVKNGSRVAIYGAGMVAEQYVMQISANKYCDIAFIAAKDYQNNKRSARMGWELVSPAVFGERDDYEYVVLATMTHEFKTEMASELEKMGVSKEKIVYEKIWIYESSYSEHGEDRIIYNAFCHIGFFRDGKLPSYIDIGAHHPYNISNTALLYRSGCRGVNIEADPELFKLFEAERPDDVSLCFGIGPKEGEAPFYFMEASGLNTFKKENIAYNEWRVEKDTGKKVKEIIRDIKNIRIRTLPDVIEEYCGGRWPDFMSIDIEGMEYESLSICDLSDGPKIIAVEVNFDGDLFVKMLDEKGYFPYLWYRENILFVRKDLEHLVHAHNRREQ